MSAPGNYAFRRAVREQAAIQAPLLHPKEWRAATKAWP